jgi:hypothetical protein
VGISHHKSSRPRIHNYERNKEVSNHAFVAAVELLTGLDIELTPDTIQTYRDGNKEFGAVYKSELHLHKYLWALVAESSRKQLAATRVAAAVEDNEPWTELFTVALEAGWDPSELAEEAGVPCAVNVKVVDDNEDSGYW